MTCDEVRQCTRCGTSFTVFRTWIYTLCPACHRAAAYSRTADFPPSQPWVSIPTAKTPPSNAAKRKAQPVATGVLAYFPKALRAIAEVSLKGNEQHNPGQPLHWDRSKSQDHVDCLVRHLLDHLEGNALDSDGMEHLRKVAWRALALLETYLENQK
jgi:hypothetical protein